MKKNLSFFKSQLVAFILLLIGSWTFGQTTLVHYELNGSYAATTNTISASNISVSGLSFGGPNQYLQTNTSGHYAEFSINTTSLADARLSFFGGINDGWGTWHVLIDSGSGFNEIDNLVLGFDILLPSTATKVVALPIGVSNLKIKILSELWPSPTLRIDDIKIISGGAKIRAYSSGNNQVHDDVHIPNNADANESYNTVFDNIQTLTSATKTYRVRNWEGSANSELSISSIVVEPAAGTTAADFIITSQNNLSNLPPVDWIYGWLLGYYYSEYGAFNITFTPQAEGVRKAKITIYSNGVPTPYSFTVIGGGRSCGIDNTPTVINTINTTQEQTLPSDLTSVDLVTGTSANSSSYSPQIFGNNVNIQPSGNNLYTSSPASWFTKGTEKVRTFGGANGVDISQLRKVSVEFNVAAFASSTSNFVSREEHIFLEVQYNGNWYQVMRLRGPYSNTRARGRYQFGQGTVFSHDFSISNISGSTYSLATRDIETGFWDDGTRASRFKLNIPLSISSQLTDFKFRIRAKGNANAVWLIDDVRITSDNAEFRVWNGSAWRTPADQSSSRPTEENNVKVVFNGDYNFGATNENSDLSICACEVNAGKTLTIPSNRTLKVRGAVTNHGNENNFIVASNANLIQIEDGAANSGSITVQRTTQLANPTNKYLLWSSPVMGQNMFSIFSATPQYVMSYDTATDYYTVLTNPATAEPGKGYSIKTPNTGGVSFKGQPNNGQIAFTLNNTVYSSGNTWNLIGNPYPSNMNLVTFYQSNSSVIDPSLYFWNNVTATNTQQTGAGATTWVVFNASGTGTWSAHNDMGSIDSNSKSIRPGQGFLVKATGTSLIFNNAMRSSGAASTVNRSSVASETDGKYWIELKTPSGLPYSMAVTYGYGGRDEYDKYDSKTMGSGSSVYTTLDEYRFSIQGKNNFREEDKVPMGISIGESGMQTLRLSDTEGVFNRNSKAIILKDNLLGIETDLAKEEYTFNSEKGRIEGRFEIIYRPTTVLNTVAAGHKDNIELYRSGEMFVIRSTVNIQKILVYDLSGRLIKDHTANSRTTEISIAGNGIFLLRIQTENGEIVNKKVRK